MRAGLVDELFDLFPDSSVAQVGSPRYTVDVARGTLAGVHVLLEGLTPGQPVVLEGGPADSAWYRLIGVPVEVNSGIEARTEMLDGKTNPHVIRRAPLRVYEALRPAHSGDEVPASTSAYRFEFPVPANARPGSRTVRLRVGQGEERVELELRVRVHEAVVPPIGQDSLGFTNWWHAENIAKFHDAPLWSEAYWDRLEGYADLMARGRQNTILVPWGSFMKREGDRFALDRTQLRRFVELFERRGILRLEGGHFAAREGGDWMAKRFVLHLTGSHINSPEGRKELAAIATELLAAIREEGWADRWMQHIADEPIDVNAEDYAEAAKQVHALMPGIPVFEATMSRSLVGAVQGWCPQVHEFQHAAEWFAERRAAGDEVWVYTCLSPTGPWLNRLIDMERLRPAMIPWALVKYDLDGFLHWGFNWWNADPYQQSVVPHPGLTEMDNMALPAGDTHVAYPGGKDVWSSTRWEAHRIGFEDAELLRRLPQEVRAPIIARVMRGFDDYTKSVREYRAAKRALLRAASGSL